MAQSQDDAFREIQLSGKQLVFLFMAVVVIAVVIFLSGVQVGRGVRAERGVPEGTEASAAPETTDPPPPRLLPARGRPPRRLPPARNSVMPNDSVRRSGPGLVDEDQAIGIESRLAADEHAPGLGDIRAVLLGRV